ncbi:MAG TPA: alpha-E domain-containing protein [Candidatus Limnocylindrales bacterium]|nr:alpha-E domain-containing protein [Candidatus Limnocylindrales bacterium]
MLARTADSLFWLARHMERAENVARILQVGHRMATMSRSLAGSGNEWRSTLAATGCAQGFADKYGDEAPSRAVVQYLVRDTTNPSSIYSCFETARRNARAVRTALTVDMWEALNETWLGARSFSDADLEPDRVAGFLDWVRHRSLLFHGAYANTMLRNDAYYFTQLGTYVERADNTARILDVKYHVLLPSPDDVGGVLDYYQWQSILRAVSAVRSYHWIFHDRLHPWQVAELLILRPEMPRSLCSCYAQITRYLDLISDGHGGKRGECHRLAGELDARLRFGRIQTIFQDGLHEFLTEIIDHTGALGRHIAEFYLIS